MSHAGIRFASVFVFAVVTGCSGDDIIGTSNTFRDGPAMAAAPPPDLAGTWEWTRLEHLTMPSWVAQMVVGIQPEGPVTQARCAAAGWMALAQSGASFSGTAGQTSISCETTGGQQFQPPNWFLPITVADGHIGGASIKFLFGSIIPAPCPHHGVITAVSSGMATALKATGRCFVPGHPRSEAPLVLPPPPGGTSKTLSWQATRP